MAMSPEWAISWAWLAWILSWFAAASWAYAPMRRAGAASEIPYFVLTFVGFALLFSTHGDDGRQMSNFARGGYEAVKFWSVGLAGGWVLFGVVVAGFAFCWWARLALGRLWSGRITLKPGHRVVDTGPYGLVRHPIYTGIILAALGTALQKGTALSLAGVAVVTFGFWIKARMEERFLRTELGAEAYDAYARRVPMLVPALLPRASRNS